MASHHPQSPAPVVNLRDYRSPNWVPPLSGVNLALGTPAPDLYDLLEDAATDCHRCGEPLDANGWCDVGCIAQPAPSAADPFARALTWALISLCGLASLYFCAQLVRGWLS